MENWEEKTQEEWDKETEVLLPRIKQNQSMWVHPYVIKNFEPKEGQKVWLRKETDRPCKKQTFQISFTYATKEEEVRDSTPYVITKGDLDFLPSHWKSRNSEIYKFSLTLPSCPKRQEVEEEKTRGLFQYIQNHISSCKLYQNIKPTKILVPESRSQEKDKEKEETLEEKLDEIYGKSRENNSNFSSEDRQIYTKEDEKEFAKQWSRARYKETNGETIY